MVLPTNHIKMKTTLICLLTLLVSLKGISQDSKLTVAILGDQTIAEVNINTDEFMTGIKALMDMVEEEGKALPESYSLAVMVTLHKDADAGFEVYSKPMLDPGKVSAMLKKFRMVKMGRAKFIDFPVVIGFNVGENFKKIEIESPHDKIVKEYEEANLAQKVLLNKQWAAEHLPILIAFESGVEDKFKGVKDFGVQLSKLDFSKKQDIKKLTDNNHNYWRATMEMSSGNLLIPLTKILMLMSQGEFDYAYKFAEILPMFSENGTAATGYLREINWRLGIFNTQLEQEIGKGIALHDNGDYEGAISVYKAILNQYPNSAWTMYEVYFSGNAKDIQEGKVELEDRAEWDKAKIAVYGANPLYNMDIRANTGKEAYLLYRRFEMSTLFKNKDERLKDVFEYADIAMDLGVYDFAAQLFWLTANYDKDASEKSLMRYMYCLEKLGVKDLKDNFNYDFEKVFKAIEKEKEDEMKNSQAYQQMKKS